MNINPLEALAPPESQTPERTTDLGRDEFLTMLIAQLENQDPLNPQDATEFTAQLAQFSSLEQLVNIEAGIEDLRSSLGGGLDGLTSAAMLGRQVVFEGTSFELGSTGLVTRPSFQLEQNAQNVTIELLKDGQRVREMTLEGLPSGTHPIADELFASLAPGLYDFKVRASDAAGPLFVRSLVGGTVDAAVPLGGETQLSIGRLTTPYSAVREVRLAEGVGE